MVVERMDRVRRAAVHAALGDPSRLAIVDELMLGDRSPSELGEMLKLPSNLVAHHLRVLESAGLVDRTRSEADRRRTYIRLRQEVASGLLPVVAVRAPRVVFVCTHNSARSQLASALFARHSRVPTASAGTRPSPRVNRRAVTVGRRHGLSLERVATAHVRDVVDAGDLVVAVCDSAYEQLGPARSRLHWSVPDPVRLGTGAAFEAAYEDLDKRVGRLVAAVDGTDAGRQR